MLRKISESPYLNIVSGVILLLTSGYEIWESFGESPIGSRHGVAIFGLSQIIKSMPEIIDGLKKYKEAEENLYNK